MRPTSSVLHPLSVPAEGSADPRRQLGLALARTFNPEPYRTSGFQKPDQQALVSLLSFIVGTSFGRFFDKLGFKRRKALVVAAFLQCLFTMAAALCSHFSGETGIAMSVPCRALRQS